MDQTTFTPIPATPSESLVDIQDLTVNYKAGIRVLTALNKVSLKIRPREILALVGESGCGKSTLGLSIINLLPSPPAKVEEGRIVFQGEDLVHMSGNEMATLRGTRISMIFQDPMSSLDPVFTVGQQITEAIEIREGRTHLVRDSYGPFPRNYQVGDPTARTRLNRILFGVSSRRSRMRKYSDEAVDALTKVGIADPRRVLAKYPHELSGGIAQRVMIAQALVEKPSILIADEPTSALDVTTQAQVLNLMKELRNEIGTSLLFITHDLAVAAQIADKVAVMYAAEISEVADVNEIFTEPLHPYTEGLITSFPNKYRDQGKLEAIGGDVPDLRSLPSGCRFHPRCRYAFDRCAKERPHLVEPSRGRQVACFLRYSK
jgi:oligopeptide/dipeptide ABC transporter ATP-binding protein